MATDAYVYEAIRTPRGRIRRDGGTLAGVPAFHLAGQLLGELASRGVQPDAVDDVILGVSTTVGEQAVDVARMAVLAADWPDTVTGGVVSRTCCSGLDAISSAAAQVRSGVAQLTIAGGAESMSRVPMLSDRPAVALDDEIGELTGFVTIGVSADYTAAHYGFGRPELEEFAVRSHERCAAAVPGASVVPVRHRGEVVLAADEGARTGTTRESLAELPALFTEDPSWARVERRFPGFTRPAQGLHTVATAPQMCDAASCAAIGSERAGQELGLRARGRIAGWGHAAVRSPGLDATLPAVALALSRAGIGVADLAVAELNESFAVSPLLLMRELGIPDEITNIRGGAVAVGHPLGASGGILLANAIELLEQRGGGYGLLVIPAALGLAAAVVVEV